MATPTLLPFRRSAGEPLSTPAAAAFLGYSTRTLERWREQGVGPAFTYANGRFLYDRSVLEAHRNLGGSLSTPESQRILLQLAHTVLMDPEGSNLNDRLLVEVADPYGAEGLVQVTSSAVCLLAALLADAAKRGQLTPTELVALALGDGEPDTAPRGDA